MVSTCFLIWGFGLLRLIGVCFCLLGLRLSGLGFVEGLGFRFFKITARYASAQNLKPPTPNPSNRFPRPRVVLSPIAWAFAHISPARRLHGSRRVEGFRGLGLSGYLNPEQPTFFRTSIRKS